MFFVIDDVFDITNVGTVVTAKIFNEIKVGDKIIIASEELTAIWVKKLTKQLIHKK